MEKRYQLGLDFYDRHSASQSKIFKKLMDTSCNIKWREANEKERIWILQATLSPKDLGLDMKPLPYTLIRKS
ncbi:hypothetical protein [Paenibacillus sp. N3.4]|uniref:hypothetical protein n=1 Tax=Paenibacillus sp. N3.4 TaxID=2603222 RepID=UPI0037C8319C